MAGWGSRWLGGRVLCSFFGSFLLSGFAPDLSVDRLSLWVLIGSSWSSFVFGRKFESDKPCSPTENFANSQRYQRYSATYFKQESKRGSGAARAAPREVNKAKDG